MKYVLLSLFLSLTFLPTFVSARTTATFGQQAVGTSCGRLEHSFDFDTLVQCTSSAASGGTKQTAPIILGTVTAPPYAATTCDANKAGMLQWTGSAFQGCNGTSWTEIGSSNPCSSGVDSFAFTDQTLLLTATTITSNAITLTGNVSTCVFNANCSACSDILRNGSSAGTTNVSVSTGQTIALKRLSSALYSTATTATLTIGNTTIPAWTITTRPCTQDIGSVCNDGTIYAGLSADGNVPMYVTPYDYGMSGTKGNLTGTRGTRAWAGEWIATGASSATNGDGNTTNLAARGTGYQAAYYCENLTALGYSDWYLPARNELATIITNKNEIGGFDSTGVYWSSTDLSTTNAYTIAIVDGLAAGYNKTGTYPVRCARK